MSDEWIYLDHNASTPMADDVVEVMKEALMCQGHPSSPHPHGRRASQAIEAARQQVAESIGCQSREVIFCSGSTEAANHVIKGVAFAQPERSEPLHFVTSIVDHSATIEPLKFLQKLGHQVTFIDVDHDGRIDPADVKKALRPNTALVTLIHGQNEVGTVQPLAEVGTVCADHSTLFHVDASQSFGKVAVDVSELQADFLNIAGHKIYGPKGVGALFIKEGHRLEPLLHGGGHEKGWRSGTPAPQLIAGLGKACQLVTSKGLLSSEGCEVLWRELQQLGASVRRNGHAGERLPNVLHLTFQGVNGRELLNAAKISASTGAACHSATVSPVLSAMGFSAEEAAGSVRLSCGRASTPPLVTEAAQRLVQAYRSLTERKVVTS